MRYADWVLVVGMAFGCAEAERGQDAGPPGDGALPTDAPEVHDAPDAPDAPRVAPLDRGAPPCVLTDPDDPCVGDAPTWPADLLSLVDWKLTLPVADPGDSASPWEIEQPDLATFALDPWFDLAGDDRVRFAANAGGVTTSGSSYPRSELREMRAAGTERAAWSTTDGVHTLTVTQAITHLPEVKPHVVAGQIHDAEDDVVMLRLEGTRLFVEAQGEDLGVLDPDYTLGDVFTARFVAADGWIDVYHQDLAAPAVSYERATDGCYFKAGAYTQSNPDRGDAPDAYGAVEIRALTVTHE